MARAAEVYCISLLTDALSALLDTAELTTEMKTPGREDGLMGSERN